jgi:hypothetical protein
MAASTARPTDAAVISTASGRVAVATTSSARTGMPRSMKTFQIPVTSV